MKYFLLFFILFTFVSLIPNTFSLTEIYKSTTEVANSSSDIIVAKCVSSESKFDENTGFIYTYTTFIVDQSVKDTINDNKIVVKVIGGQVGDLKLDFEGSPKFYTDEDLVIFLGPKNSQGHYALSSLLRGYYKIDEDLQTGQKILKNPPTDIYNSYKTGNVNSTNYMPLKDFIDYIENSID